MVETLTFWSSRRTIMENSLKREIKRLCRRAFDRANTQLRIKQKHREKFTRRTGLSAGIPSNNGALPLLDRHFCPAYCTRNAEYLARSIWMKVRSREYRPKPAIKYKIPKPRGGFREIMAFSIPDAALANLMLRTGQSRNLKRMSPFSYAYHPEKNVFDAVLALSGFINDQRLFAVQIDFQKYFDTIPTRYLKHCVDNTDLISLTPDERFVFKELMHHQFAEPQQYLSQQFERRIKGTPQGSSASLLLANLANHSLDKALERKSGRFVRFADDVVAVCSTYAEAEEIESTFTTHCEKSGLIINEKKSKGIAIISSKEMEIRTFSDFDYLGYLFTKKGLSIPQHIVKRIKMNISRLIQIYLIHYPNKFDFNPSRCGQNPDFDWDLLGLITEIRGYLYGGLSEQDIRLFLNSGSKPQSMRGLMGFYALLDNKEDLRILDGWLADSICRAMRKRNIILQNNYSANTITPTKSNLILGNWLNPNAWQGNDSPDASLPSFVRGWRAARKYYFTFGLEDVQPPSYGYY